MSSSIPPRPPLRAAATLLLIAVSATACHDASGDPVAALLTAETRAALALGEGVPSLPELVRRAGLVGQVDGAAELWADSWSEEGEAALQARDEAYGRVADALARVMGRDGVLDFHARLGESIALADQLPSADLGPDIEARLDAARGAHRRVEVLLDGPNGGRDADASALETLLRASDDLRAVGPEGVARTLVARAERAMGVPAAAGDAAAEAALDRGGRLVRGARAAIEEADWSRAIRRAWYACQVLGVSPL